MSETRFLQTLQALLTMVDANSPTSIACVKAALESILALAIESNMANDSTIELIEHAIIQLDQLVLYKDDFAGRPGDYAGNKAKQKRLANMLRPGC